MAALAGANLIYGAGMTESGVTFDYAQYVLDNDMARMIKHTVQGVLRRTTRPWTCRTSTPWARSATTCRWIRPCKHMRELSQPRFLDRRVREDWQAMGARDAYGAAKEAAKQILEEH